MSIQSVVYTNIHPRIFLLSEKRFPTIAQAVRFCAGFFDRVKYKNAFLWLVGRGLLQWWD